MKIRKIRLFTGLVLFIAAGIVFCCTGLHSRKAEITDAAHEQALSASDVQLQDPADALPDRSVSTDPDVLSEYENVSAPAAPQSGSPASDAEDLWVYVCGSVFYPGVYCLKEGARIYEAIERAGGFTAEADRNSLNLALTVTDGQRIYVPDQTETAVSVSGEPYGDPYPYSEDLPGDERVNINTASAEELKTLPGIGDSKAAAILAYREEQAFITIEEIMNVPGIKESAFRKIRDLIRV